MASEGTDYDKIRVLLGVSGGIAAYKAVDLASKLTGIGFDIRVVMTESACELIRPKSFEAVTGNAVYTELWSSSEQYQIGHINLAQWSDLIVIAPATADIIGKMAGGICDDLLSTVLCASWKKPKLMAPAMNNNMWSNPAVQRNVECVKKMGFELIGPEAGRLACGAEGPGRMSEASDILAMIERIACTIGKRE